MQWRLLVSGVSAPLSLSNTAVCIIHSFVGAESGLQHCVLSIRLPDTFRSEHKWHSGQKLCAHHKSIRRGFETRRRGLVTERWCPSVKVIVAAWAFPGNQI
jgi:hypothetical protein